MVNKDWHLGFERGYLVGSCITAAFFFAVIFYAEDADAGEFLGSDVSVWLGSQTITDGEDAFLVGVTLGWKHVELDFGHGIKRTKWRTPVEPEWEMNDWQSGTIISIRGYPFNTQRIKPLLIWSHSSDIMRGKPFNEKEEPTSDFMGAGVTFVLEKPELELDIAYGAYGRECNFMDCAPGSQSNEILIALRVNFQ